ncbi:MAG: efflux RND transporter periplasmic adaptor subunit [Thermoanaerobaculia bacterium]|nr:efflux RND transporter periplasmic adaptor subunit [Thermoanaerobaculia bacterium]
MQPGVLGTGRWLGLAVFLLVGALLWGCAGEAAGGSEPVGGLDADGLLVVRGQVQPVVLLTGRLVAEDAVRLTAPNVNIWPMTVRWIAEEGDEVAEGETVVEFDNSQLTSNLEALRSQMVSAANALSQAGASTSSQRAQAFFELEQSKADWEKARLAAELPRELTSEQEWARLQLELEKAAMKKEKSEKAMAAIEASSKASIDVEKLALQKAEMALARAERGVAVLNLTAPRTGVVQVAENPQEDRPFRSGDTTFPGLTVASLPDLDSLYVEASLFDVDDGRVQPGAAVRASLDAFPGEILHGEVRAVAGFAQQEGRRSSRRSFQVQVDLEGIDPSRMRPGMSVKLEVLSDPAEGLLVSRRALSIEGDDIYLRLANGERVSVTLGACDRLGCLVESEQQLEGQELAPAVPLSSEDLGT